jgi:NTP pyrophosphatase (non-canonical NTP hydrolase)
MDIDTKFSESVAFRMRMDKPAEIMKLTWALGLVGETGEVVDLIKKHIGHSHPLDRDKLVKELGDVEWYMEAMRQAHKLERNPYLDCIRHYPKGEVSACKEALDLATEVGCLVSLSVVGILRVSLNVVDCRLASIYKRYGITREEALAENIKKLEARYPNGFSTEDSINRKDTKC